MGRKTAQRIILELKEKVLAAGVAGGVGSTDSDVVAALESLGYTASEARRAAGAVAGADGELDARIKAALQELARSRRSLSAQDEADPSKRRTWVGVDPHPVIGLADRARYPRACSGHRSETSASCGQRSSMRWPISWTRCWIESADELVEDRCRQVGHLLAGDVPRGAASASAGSS